MGVLTLGKFVKDSADPNGEFGDDGTPVTYGAAKSHLVWDHVKHKRHLLNDSSFNAFCTHGHSLLSDKVHYAFSSE